MAEDVGGWRLRRWLLVVLLFGCAGWLLWSRRPAGSASPAPAALPVRAFPIGPGAVAVVPAARTPASEAGSARLPGAAVPLPDGSAPSPEYTIKGNAGSMLFHLPSSPYYARTKPEMWFRTPEDAAAAGFTQWRPKKRAPR